MNKFIILTEYFYPGDRPDSYLLTEITKVLSKVTNGQLKVICNTELQDKPELEFIKDKIQRLKENKLNKDNIFFRIIKFIISTIKLSWVTFFTIKQNDKLFSVTNPAFIIVILGLFKKVKNFHYVLLVFDVFPENLGAAGLLKKDSYIYTITKKIFDWSYMQADHLVVIGRDMEEVINEKTNSSVSTSLITNWSDISQIIPADKKDNPIIKKFELENKIVFAFIGNFGRVQGIEKLLEMATLVKNPKFRLLFIGDGAMRPSIESHIEQDKDGTVIYAGSYPLAEQNIFLNACDIAVVSLSDMMYGLGVPSKSYNNMAAGKPLFYLGDEKSEVGRVIKENKIGWVCYNMSASQLAESVDEIISNNSELYDYSLRARETVEKYYSKEIVLKKYEDLFMGLKNLNFL